MVMVRVNGVEVSVARLGHGPPLVLVHGAGMDGRAWQPQLKELAKEFTVVAWDEPGAGRSSDLPVGFGLADFAHCLAVGADQGPEPAGRRLDRVHHRLAFRVPGGDGRVQLGEERAR